MTLRILVADDDDGYRFPIVNILDDYGFQVLEASNMEDAIEHGSRVEILVMDVRLPTSDMEGILAVNKLVDEGKILKYPVIFISVIPESLAGQKLDLLRKNKIPYIWVEKPFEPELLLEKIKDLMKGRRHEE